MSKENIVSEEAKEVKGKVAELKQKASNIDLKKVKKSVGGVLAASGLFVTGVIAQDKFDLVGKVIKKK